MPEAAVDSPEQNGRPADQTSVPCGPRNQLMLRRSPEDKIVLVMGAAGSGKSTLISSVSGLAVEATRNVGNCTNECKEWAFDYRERRVTLIDTPGFDNASGWDFDIVNSIVKCIERLGHVSGVIYLHRITDKRMTGSARRNINILQELCGREFSPHIILATSMWNDVSEKGLSDACAREKQLQDHFWKNMIGEGALCFRFDGTRDLGQLLIEPLVSTSHRSLLAVEADMHTMPLQYTRVGRLIMSELRVLEERYQREGQGDEDHQKPQSQALVLQSQGMAKRRSPGRYRHRQGGNNVVPRPLQDGNTAVGKLIQYIKGKLEFFFG